MNFDSIIEEELDEARERIKSRLAALMLGGGGVERRASPPVPVLREDRKNRENISHQRIADEESVLVFLKENPGSSGVEIVEHLKLSSAKESRYLNVMKYLRVHKQIMSRGQGKLAKWWVTREKVSTPAQTSVNRTRKKTVPSLTKEKAEGRDLRIIEWLKAHPGAAPVELQTALASPRNGSRSALGSATKRMREGGRIIAKIHAKKKTPQGQPVVQLFAK